MVYKIAHLIFVGAGDRRKISVEEENRRRNEKEFWKIQNEKTKKEKETNEKEERKEGWEQVTVFVDWFYILIADQGVNLIGLHCN